MNRLVAVLGVLKGDAVIYKTKITGDNLKVSPLCETRHISIIDSHVQPGPGSPYFDPLAGTRALIDHLTKKRVKAMQELITIDIKNLSEKSVDLEPAFSESVDKHFWKLI